MSDTTTKQLIIKLSGRDDGASQTMDKVAVRATILERQLKKIGKITGIGGFRGASDVAEGLSGEIGALGKVAGIVAGVELLGRSMKAVGDGLQSAVDKGESFANVIDDVINKIYGIGTLKEGFESLGVGIAKAEAAMLGFNKASQEKAGRRGSLAAKAAFNPIGATIGLVEELTGEADAKTKGAALDARTKKIRDAIEANKKDEEESNKVIRQGFSQRKQIEAEKDIALEKIMDRRREWANRNGGLSEEAQKRFQNEEAQIIRDANAKIQKLMDDRSEAEAKVFTDRLNARRDYEAKLRGLDEDSRKVFAATADAQESTAIQNLKDSGKGLEAQLREIRQSFKQQRDEIDAEIRAAGADPKLLPGERADIIKRLNGQRGALDIQQAGEERSTKRDAQISAAEKVLGLTETTYKLMADGGTQAQKMAVQRVELFKQALETQKAIDELLKDDALSPDQRAILQGQRAGLPGLLSKAITAASPSLTAIGGGINPNTDARFSGGALAQSSRVQIVSPDKDATRAAQEMAKALAEIGKKTVTATTALESILTEFRRIQRF